MNSQAKVLLQLVFHTYLCLLVFLIIILSKYFDLFSKLLSNRDPVAALGTLVLLSYSKFLRFIIAALRYRILDYPDDNYNLVVWRQCAIFHSRSHSSVCWCCLYPHYRWIVHCSTFFGHWFPRCSKVMKWTKFMDAYHAPFTPKHRYWVGLLFFALIIHNIVAAMAPDTSFPTLSSGVLSVGLHDRLETTK